MTNNDLLGLASSFLFVAGIFWFLRIACKWGAEAKKEEAGWLARNKVTLIDKDGTYFSVTRPVVTAEESSSN